MIGSYHNERGAGMKAADLDMRELLVFDPKGGVIRYAGQRVLLIDAVALGLLRKELIATLGAAAARAILTRFGYAHGSRAADTLRTQFPWDDAREWQQAGGKLHTLQGLVVSVSPATSTGIKPEPFAQSIWHESYEAEQHLLHLGVAEEPVCWTLTGFASGYLSRAHGCEVYCFEERCRGKGDSVCHLVARRKEDLSEADASQLAFYQTACLNEALAHVAAELKQIEGRLRSRRRELGANAHGAVPLGIVAQSAGMQRVLEIARRVAKVDSTVLITGESGVGKERIACLIHEESMRAGGPYVAINCGAVPESLLESELFGHSKGAFTGAAQDRPGLFEAANGGTLFLDEIGEVPPAMQVKLLRALQEHEVRRVGENRNRQVNVRVLAATNRDMVAEVHAARFRQDLYYRLRVIEIHVPPLRERREDILPLARAFLSEIAGRVGRKTVNFTPAAANQLVHYGWPGNVRELENAIEHAVVLAMSNCIDVADLPEQVGLDPLSIVTPTDIRPLEEIERDYIMAVMRAVSGNKARAAEQLGIGPATLYRKLKRYDEAGGGREHT
jgi:two-component system, NtrC family, response regulator HydG